jgi:hypothetical protein
VNDKFKLLLDECVGKNIVHALRAMIAPTSENAEIAHILDFHPQGVTDEEWIPRIAEENWIVLTGDRAKQSSRGGKLPILCQAFRVTHVMLSAAIHKMKAFDKERAIVQVWHDLARLVEVPRGSGYSLRLTPSKNAKLVWLYDPEPNPAT